MGYLLDAKKELETQVSKAGTYQPSDEDKEALALFTERKDFLKEFRKSSGIEEIWKAADQAYIPHKIKAVSDKKTFVSDDELGWRSKAVDLNRDDNWQEESVPPNPYIKIQTALGIIVDRNPTAILEPANSKYENNNLLMKSLYENSWNTALSRKIALKPFVFNCAKYGIGIGRTFPWEHKRESRELVKFNKEDPSASEYITKEYTYYDDVFRESLNPWQVYLDDATVIGNPYSMNDVIYYKDYPWHKLKRQFGHLASFKNIKPSKKVISETDNEISALPGNEDNKKAKYQERIWFWENLDLDLFTVITEDGIVLVNDPIPKSIKNKRLSIWTAPWTMRDDKNPNGIGIYEAMRNDQQMYTKVRNMTMDQLVLSIYREFFYSGTNTLEGDGQMKVQPGRGRQVNDAKNIKWNDVPGPGREAWEAQADIMARIDDVTGISKSLQGEVTGSTAFEISQARESALKRMKTPLENITDALEVDGYISIGIFEDLYSVPKIKLIAEDKYIQPFELSSYEVEDGSELEAGVDYETEPKEFSLNIERKETGEFEKTESKNFLKLREDDFPWEGTIKIKGQSIIADSELLERTTIVEMANIVFPLFQAPREIAEKPARQIIKAYGKEAEDWLPEIWLQPAPEPAAPNVFSEVGATGEVAESETPTPAEGLEKLVPGVSANAPAANITNSIGNMGK